MNVLDQLEDLERKAMPRPWSFWPGYGISPQEGVTLCFDGGPFDAEPDANTAAVIAMRNALPALLRVARAAWAVQKCPVDSPSLPAVYDELSAALAELTKEAT